MMINLMRLIIKWIIRLIILTLAALSAMAVAKDKFNLCDREKKVIL